MSHRQDDLVRSFLRPSEIPRVTLNVKLKAQSVASYSGDQPGADTEALQRSQRLLSIVTHDDGKVEEARPGIQIGTLFRPAYRVIPSFIVFKLDGSNNQLQITATSPITGDVTLAVSQAKQQSFESLSSASPTLATSAFILTIGSNSEDTSPQAFITGDVQKLRTFSAEYRRLKAIAVARKLNTSDNFLWLRPYQIPLRTRVVDLRTRKVPLQERLSKASAGLPGHDPPDISIVRDEWIRRAATAKATIGHKSLRLRLGSFNANGKIPSQDLSPWLRGLSAKNSIGQPWISPLEPLSPLELLCDSPSEEEDKDDPLIKLFTNNTLDMKGGDPDVFVLGFQELDLSTEALLYATSSTKEEMWTTAIFAGLGEKGILYEKLISTQLVGMLLIVIVKKALRSCFSDVRFCYAGAGIMGFMGNKGATAVRLEFSPNSPGESRMASTQPIALTFVNAHLAAFDEMVERRNYDFHDLSARMTFPSAGGAGHDTTFTLYQYLNYRIDLSDSDIRTIMASHPDGDSGVQSMVAYDQLRSAIHSNEAFSGFVEHPITHLPTYRYAVGISRDPLGYDTKRKPAWTDRIMHMSSPDINVKQLRYGSHPEITLSDHQPISADFYIPVAIVAKETYKEHACELHQELSGYEESGKKPHIKVQTSNLDFGPIFYKRSTKKSLVLLNDGDVPCVFRFLSAAPDAPVSPNWLHIEPIVGLLRPKETVAITTVAYVDDAAASKLNLRPPRPECTLILHTALGKDHFISVRGDYQYTCFANTLERLVRLPGPIRKLQTPEDLMPSTQALNAPREVIRLINWMMTNASEIVWTFACQESRITNAQHMQGTFFRRPAKRKLCAIIRECLDTGDEFPPMAAEGDRNDLSAAVASTLVAFLDSLVVPVIPPSLHARCLQAKDREAAFELLDEFPRASINVRIPEFAGIADTQHSFPKVWISLTAFLHYVGQRLSASGKNGSQSIRDQALRLAMLFAPILLRDDPSGEFPRVSPIGKRDFLLYFIV
ncbi:DNase I-like protein [Pisolithus sp. B1]|nr:DNase I-like protein [Pisolithus sp. B1]